MRGRSIAGGVVGALGLAALAVLAVDRWAATDVLVHGGVSLGGFALDLHCVRHRFSATEWRIEGAGWRAELPSSARLGPVGLGNPSRAVPAVWADRARAWAIVAIDDPPRACAEDEEEAPEWLDADEESVERASGEVSVLSIADVRGRHEAVLAPGSRLAEPLRYCLVEVASGVRFCVVTEAHPLDRVLVPDVALVELLDLAPRTLLARSLEDGRVLWRTVVPEDARDVWLVRAEDGGLGLRANEDFFALNPASGALERITPDGGQVCTVPPESMSFTVARETRIVGVGGGVVGITPVHPARFAELARTAPDAALTDCETGRDEVWVYVAAPAVPGATVADPVRVEDATAPLAGGASLYVVGGDGTLRAAYSAPWGDAFEPSPEGLVARTASGVVGIEHEEGVLRLATPEDDAARRFRARPIPEE